jgi:hypothetical protein
MSRTADMWKTDKEWDGRALAAARARSGERRVRRSVPRDPGPMMPAASATDRAQ